jgi:hypothetical protein
MAITETINLIVLRKATIRPLKQLSGMVRQACARAPDSSEEPALRRGGEDSQRIAGYGAQFMTFIWRMPCR